MQRGRRDAATGPGEAPFRSEAPTPARSRQALRPIAARAGDRNKAYATYRKAADREANIMYTEPPSYPRPVVEGWANVALALGDYATAEKGYREALAREPGSGRALFGLAASLDRLGKATEARDARARAAKAWANADASLPQVQQLRTSTAAVAPQQ